MPLHMPSKPVSLLSRRTRQDLVEILVRAHRAGDKALVCQCQTELDRQSRMHAGRAATAAAR